VKTAVLSFVMVAGIALSSFAEGAEGRFLWTNLDVTGHGLHAIDIDGDGELEFTAGKGLDTVFVAGKSGEVDVPLDHFSEQILFADMNLDEKPEVVLLTTRLMTVGKVIAIDFSSWGNWDTMARWESRNMQLFSLYDFNLDNRPEIIGADGKRIFLLDPASGRYIMHADTGVINSASVGHLTGAGDAKIAAYKWDKTSRGRFSYVDQWTAFRYDLKLCVIEPFTGNTIACSTPTGKPVRQIMTADLSGAGIDDAISVADTEVMIMRDGEVVSEYAHEVDLTYEYEELIKDLQLDSLEENYNVHDKFTGAAVGDFHSNPGLEIAATTSFGFMIALNEKGEVLWSRWAKTTGNPAIADVDGDGAQELIAATYKGSVKALDGQSGSERYSFSPSFHAVKVIVADADSDGKLDIIAGGEPGLCAWTMDTAGKIEWGVPKGDAMGTCNYGLSREYLKRIADPAAYSNYQWIVRGIVGGVILILGITAFVLVRHYSSIKRSIESVETSSKLAKMEKAYLNNPQAPEIVIPLAREYAANKSLGLRAMEVYRKAVKMAPGDKEIVMAAARAMVGRKIINPETEEIFRRALNHAPDDYKFIEMLARLYAEKNRADSAALHIYYACFSGSSYNKGLALTVARVLKEAGCRDDFSTWLYQQALAINTGDMELLFTLLSALKYRGRAEQYLQWAVKYISDPRLTDGMRQRIAVELEAMGMPEEAARFRPA